MAFPGHLKLICEFAILWQWLFESDITLNFFNLFFFTLLCTTDVTIPVILPDLCLRSGSTGALLS